MQRKLLILVFAILLPVFTLSAQSLPPVNPAQLSGDVIVAGGEAGGALMMRMSERFSDAGFTGNINVDAVGTTEAFQRFCNNQVDIVAANRTINTNETAACTANGRNPVAFRVAAGAVIVGVSAQNSFLTAVSAPELQQIFTALNWTNVRPEFPDNPINRFIPDRGSDAVNTFAEKIFGGQASQLLTGIGTQEIAAAATRLQSVSGDPFAIGFFSAGTATVSAPNFRVIPVNGVTPNADSITNNTYLLAFPIVLYTDSALLSQQPQIAGLINYTITNVSADVTTLGLYAASSADLAAAQNTFVQNSSGSTPQQPTPTPEILDPVITEEPSVPETPPTPEPLPTAETPPVVEQSAEALDLLVAARNDLELLATEMLGLERPVGWSGIGTPGDPELALLLRLDLEILTASLIGAALPADWFGAAPGTEYGIARDIRHDLEVLADDVLGENVRPSGWANTDPLLRCDRATQTLVNLLERGGVFEINVLDGDPNFCREVELQAVSFSDANLLGNGGGQAVFVPGGSGLLPGAVQVDSEFGVAFLDTNALLKVGTVPTGTVVNPIGRSTTLFSRMTLVQGDGFLVFMDYQDTTMTKEQFNALPAFSRADDPFCNAAWCGA